MADEKKKILHVEDDKNIALLVRAILEKAGYQVTTAYDAMQGLMLARQIEPDLVVLDVMMPAGGGGSVYERLRAMSTTCSVPVLVYSAAEPSEIAKKITAGPLTKILQKPAPPGEIVESVRVLLSAAP